VEAVGDDGCGEVASTQTVLGGGAVAEPLVVRLEAQISVGVTTPVQLTPAS